MQFQRRLKNVCAKPLRTENKVIREQELLSLGTLVMCEK